MRDKKSVRALQTYINQNGYKITVDGIYGNQTEDAIDKLPVPPWLKIALHEVGIKEIKGSSHNSRIIEYQQTTAGRYKNDEVPWCGSFTNWVLRNTFKNPITVQYPERAKSWLDYGVSNGEPSLGSIAIKSRDGGGHVCFVLGQDMFGYLYCVGGNQNDTVNIQRYPKNVFIDFRLPKNSVSVELPIFANLSEGSVKES